MRIHKGLPSFLQPLHTDEFAPRLPSDEVLGAVHRARELAGEVPAGNERFWHGRRGTAAALLAVNEAFDAEFYAVPPEAATDPEAADEALGGDEVVVDVQTHYVADRDQLTAQHLIEMYRLAGPAWWKGLEGHTAYSFGEYLRCVFVDTETAVAVLSSSPGVEDHRQLYNEEMAATRRLLDEFGGRGRLINHTVVDPTRGELDHMARWVEECRPAAWKVYTLGEANADPAAYTADMSWRELMPGKWREETGWMLDDDGLGRAFLDRVSELARVGGPDLICAHKGISGLVDTGSPRDIGPVAAAYPGLRFIVYHSGYEITDAEEREYRDEVAGVGTNRLVRTLRDHGIGPGGNVYAELGSTWFLVSARPREAAHVLGKLLVALGEDNIVWGTDSVWYGPTQQLIDSFRAFQIPEAMQEEFGYPALTSRIKDKILSRNAARVYGIDLDRARSDAENDDLVWIREAFEYYRTRGNPA
jgi:predicted TIM-barrel fold metal-dependent hydrolase